MIGDAASGAILNLLVGRTFAKAFGLAGLRAGALAGSVERLAPIRRAILPYTLNAHAVALPAALDDREHATRASGDVNRSDLLHEVLGRAGVRFWPSDGNFVLVYFGEDLDRADRRRRRRAGNQYPRSFFRSGLCWLCLDHCGSARPHPAAGGAARGGAAGGR